MDRELQLDVGSPVEVWNRSNRHWSNGFFVADIGEGDYRLRRASDDRVLPVWFAPEEVRPSN